MNIMILKIKSIFLKYLPEFASILLFLVLIPLYSHVNFYQNDDWNRNTTILRFIQGDFKLLEVTATTFYSQGFLGFLWAWVFGPTKIPYLTLLISVLNFFLFWKILLNIKFSTTLNRFLVSFLLFTNPLHIYSSIGFMTENYVIFYLLLAVFFLTKYQENSKSLNLYLSGFFGFLAFYSKQSALVFLFGFSLYFLINKKWKEFKVFVSYLLISLSSYYLLFPRTSEMKDKDFSFLHLNFSYLFSLFYGILIYLIFFTLPFIIYFVCKIILQKQLKTIFLISFLVPILFYLFNNIYKPGLISWQEFPYFENTFERTGFLPRTIDGTKYQFKYNFDLYRYIDIISKLGVVFLISFFISKFVFSFQFKRIINYLNDGNLFIILISFVLMFFVSIFFDRYILVFLPFFILLFIKHIDNTYTKLLSLFLIGFVIFQSYFSYFLASDFIYSHNYIWNKSIELVRNDKLNPSQIDATGAWNRNYKLQNPIYVFSYDSPKVNENYSNNYVLIEIKEIKFLGNLFINPKIYLYKSK